MIEMENLRGLDAHKAAFADLGERLAELDKEANGQTFTDGQRAEFEGILSQRKQLEAAIDELGLREIAVQEAAGKAQSSEPGSGFSVLNLKKSPDNIYDLASYRTSSVDQLADAYRDGAARVVEAAVFPTAAKQDVAKEQVTKLLEQHRNEDFGAVARRVIATGSPQYAEAWGNHILGRPNSGRLQAVLQTYTDADGGVAIPFTIDPTFINTSNGSVNPLRQISRIETITTKNWQAVTTAGVTAAYVGERTTTGAADSAPTDFLNPTATPVRADVAVDVSAEYLADYGSAALVTEVGAMIQIAKDDLEADKFVNGEGAGEPEGIVDALVDDATSIVPTITNDVFALADIDLLIHTLPPRFRPRAQFMANLGILQLIPAFGTAGQPGNAVYDAYAQTLRGKPVNESSRMDDVATDQKMILLFGDFGRGFVIVDRLGLSTRVLDARDTNGRPTGNSVIYASWRNTSKLLFPNAFRLLKVQ